MEGAMTDPNFYLVMSGAGLAGLGMALSSVVGVAYSLQLAQPLGV
jgi:hypothetical protein